MSDRIRALRGAITLDKDTKEQVIERTGRLIQTMLDRNQVSKDDLVSIIFTATPDLASEFPAAGARSVGLSDIPLENAQVHWNLPYYDNTALYWERSPLAHVRQCRTPLLIAHGDSDRRVPVGQAVELYTALRLLGRQARHMRHDIGHRAADHIELGREAAEQECRDILGRPALRGQ